MKYGCRAHDHGRQSAASLARNLSAMGYDAAQLTLPRAIEGIETYSDIEEAQLAEVKAAFAQANVEISVLSCYMDLTNPDAQVRMTGVENIRRYLRYAKFLGARQVGSETGYNNELTAEEKDTAFPWLLDCVLRIVEEAARVDAVFSLEPVFTHPLYSPELLQKVLETVGDPVHLKVIFDPVNQLNPYTAAHQEETWRSWIQVIGKQLGAVHVKDARILPDGARCPTALGQGQMDYRLISQWLHRDYPDIPLLRDEGILSCAREDLLFMRDL